MPVLRPCPPHEGKDVARPIADADPALVGSSRANRFDYLRPHITLLRTFSAGGAGLGAFLALVPRPDPLVCQAQDLGYRGGPHGQTTVQEKPASAGVADPAQTLRLAMG